MNFFQEPEKTTEELQEELQNDLKARALKSMKKRKLAKLKAQAQGKYINMIGQPIRIRV